MNGHTHISRDCTDEFLSRGKGGVAYWHRAIALCYFIFAFQANENEPVGSINIFCRLKNLDTNYTNEHELK
jgi:hypothetical protein